MNMSEIKQAVMRGNFSTTELQSLMSNLNVGKNALK